MPALCARRRWTSRLRPACWWTGCCQLRAGRCRRRRRSTAASAAWGPRCWACWPRSCEPSAGASTRRRFMPRASLSPALVRPGALFRGPCTLCHAGGGPPSVLGSSRVQPVTVRVCAAGRHGGRRLPAPRACLPARSSGTLPHAAPLGAAAPALGAAPARRSVAPGRPARGACGGRRGLRPAAAPARWRRRRGGGAERLGARPGRRWGIATGPEPAPTQLRPWCEPVSEPWSTHARRDASRTHAPPWGKADIATPAAQPRAKLTQMLPQNSEPLLTCGGPRPSPTTMEGQHRVAVIQRHLAPAPAEDAPAVLCQPTAAQAQAEREYSVALPERLTPAGPWLVHRSLAAPPSPAPPCLLGSHRTLLVATWPQAACALQERRLPKPAGEQLSGAG